MNNIYKIQLLIVAFLMLCFNIGDSAPKRAWSTSVAPGALLRADWTEGATLATAPDMVYVASTRGYVAALDSRTGRKVWRIRNKGVLPYGIAVDGKGIYLGFADGTFRSYSPLDGTERWSLELASAIVSAPTEWNGMVYFLTGDDTLYAVDAETGEWKWKYPRDTRKQMSILGLARPVIRNNVVFVGMSDGVLVALNALTGELLWGKRPSESRNRFEDMDSMPVVTESTVFTAIYEDSTYGIKRESGNVVWTFEKGSIEPIAMTTDGKVIVSGQDNYIHALNAVNGQELWKVTAHNGKSRLTGVVVADGKIVFGAHWGGVYVVDAGTGERIEHFTTWGGVYATPAYRDGKAFVIDGRGDVEAYNIR